LAALVLSCVPSAAFVRWHGRPSITSLTFFYRKQDSGLCERFLILRIAPRGDVFGAYWVEAKAVRQNLVPYRDFLSSYAPLHSYLDALVIHIWFSPLAIILLAICVEALILPLWFRVGRIFLSEQEIRSSTLLYITSAMLILSRARGSSFGAVGKQGVSSLSKSELV
jgi:hypothetical protein